MPDHEQTTEAGKRLGALLPTLPSSPKSPDSGSTENPSSFWTPEEQALGRRLWLQRKLEGGWKMTDHGTVTKGEGKHKVEARLGVTYMLPRPGDQAYNPLAHAPALRLYPGAVLVGANRYRTVDGHLVDQWGAFKEPDGCPECGSGAGRENRFRVLVPSRNPFAKPWEQTFTYCRRCCTPEEVQQLREGAGR